MVKNIPAALSSRLKRSRRTVAVAESCTAGLLGYRLTEIAGSSDYFLGGVIAYRDKVKTKLLGVPEKLLKRDGAVNPQTAASMARRVRRLFGSDYGVSITGVAGPGGGTQKKPVGLVYAAVSSATRTIGKEYRFRGARAQVRSRSAQAALELLLGFLTGKS